MLDAVATAVGATGLTAVSVLAATSAVAAGTAGPLGAPALSPAFLAAHLDTHGYAYDNAHSGYNPAVPAVGRIAKAWTANLDGVVQASPLVVGKTVIAATEHNTVYGLDRRTGRVLWSRHLGAPVDGSTLPCGQHPGRPTQPGPEGREPARRAEFRQGPSHRPVRRPGR